MSEYQVKAMKKMLKTAVAPIGKAELQRDLWPSMLQRLAEGSVRVPWWDWVLLAGASLALWFFPGMVPALLYHL
jgi:hypothetical protein